MAVQEEYIRPELIVSLAERSAEDINRYLNRPLSDLPVIIANPLFIDYHKNIDYLLFEEAELCREKLAGYLLTFSKLNTSYHRLRFVCKDKKTIVKIEKGKIVDERKEFDDPIFTEGRRFKVGEVCIHGLIPAGPGMPQLLAYSTPLYSEINEFKGLLIFELDFDMIVKLLERTISGKGDLAYIVGREGGIIAASEKTAEARGDGYKEVLSQMTALKTGWADYKRGGVQTLIAYAPIKARAWSLAIEVPAPDKAKIEEYSRDLRIKIGERTRELEETQKRALQSEGLAVVGRLAGIMGHELRNPLAVIKNSAYYIGSKIKDEKEGGIRKHFGMMNDAIAVADKIVSDVLNYGRIKKPVVGDVDIGAVLDSSVAWTSIPPNIKVTFNVQAPLPEILADAVQVRQVFMNIILNAVQAMPDGGALNCSSSVGDGYVNMVFADTGCGIEEENLEKIFELLYSSKSKGFGLGLNVCRMIMEGHNGKIDVESKLNKGTTVTVRFPLKQKR